MAQAKRIYVVTNGEGSTIAFVNAVHPAQAINRATRGSFTAKVATQQEVLTAGRNGTEILEVSETDAAE